MRRIAIYFSAPNFQDPPFDKPDYAQSYADFAQVVINKGGDLYIARGKESYRGNATFAHGWQFVDGGFIPAKEFKADVIYNKGEDFEPDADTFTVVRPAFDALTMKDKTYELFSELSPKTILVQQELELKAALEQLSTDTIVAKPIDEACGRGIFIGPRHDAPQNVSEYPILLQEFIETSAGIPNITEGIHDFRVVIIGGNVAMAYVRTPAPGTMLANVAQGGSVRLVPVEDIPEGAMQLVHTIDAALAQYPERVYSIDMGLHEAREWKLIELNTQPGMTSKKWGKGVEKYYEMLAEHLINLAK